MRPDHSKSTDWNSRSPYSLGDDGGGHGSGLLVVRQVGLYDALGVGVGTGRDGQGGRDGAAGRVADADQLVPLAFTGSRQVRDERRHDQQTQQGHDEPGGEDVKSKEMLELLEALALSKNPIGDLAV